MSIYVGISICLSATVTGGLDVFTGAVSPTILTTPPAGWLLLNGDTLGSAASVADQADNGNQALFEAFWDSMADTEAAVSGGRGASATADWNADKTLMMPDARGRTLIMTGQGPTLTNRVNGISDGEEAHILAEAELAVHGHGMTGATVDAVGDHTHPVQTHDFGSTGDFVGNDQGGSPKATPVAALGAGAHSHGISGSIDDAGSGEAHENMPPFLALNLIVKV